jgi:hypothetical protein
MTIEDLPGGDLIATGLADIRAGSLATPEALLVSAAAGRLRSAGVPVPTGAEDADATTKLYHALQPEHGNDAHGRYLALLRQLESFARAAEHAARR